MSHPQTGKKIENYVFNYSDFLGSGNFSKCYKATDLNTQEKVAIKIVELNTLKSKKLEELLYSEIAVLKELKHPNVLRCLEVFTSNRNCYIITELCDEGDLETKINKAGPLDSLRLQNIISDVYEGLLYLSSKGIIHRDLKVANIFLKNGVAKIADFGFAVHAKTNFKDLNIGSPLYMSPEGFLSNSYGPKTDVWAFGIMIYELTHHKTPFHRCLTERDLKVSILTPIHPSSLKNSVPADLRSLILSCLQISEEKRPLIKDLQDLPYIKSIRRSRNSLLPSHFTLKSPPKLQIAKLAQQPSTQDRNRSSHKAQKAFMSEEHARRLTSPQKFLTNTVNCSLEINTYKKNQGFQQQIPNSTINFNFESPQGKRSQHFPAEAECTAINHNSSLRAVRPLPLSSPQKNDKVPPSSPLVQGGQLNFKESVSLLHYCRLIFKYLEIYQSLTGLRDEAAQRHHFQLSCFILAVLSEVYAEIVARKIHYEGENPDVKEKKLNDVTKQYLTKYSKELNQSAFKTLLKREEEGPIDLSKFKEVVEGAVVRTVVSERCSNEEAIAGELLLVIYSSTVLLELSRRKKNFGQFQKSREIEDTLNRSKQGFTFASYQSHRNRVFTTLF